MTQPPNRLFAHLAFLYGEPQARSLAPRLDALITRTAPAIAAAPRPLTQQDAILITYGDQVRDPNGAIPPLRVLASFVEAHLDGLLSAIHLLPFYPSTSDDGFSVVDYRRIDPDLGTWEDVARIGRRFDLMFDAVINHISAQSDWFRRFLQDDPLYRNYFISVEGNPDLSSVVRPRALPLLTRFETAAGIKHVWTTFSADQIDLNYANPDVLLAILDTLLFYAAHGARFIRLDAIAYLWKEIGTACIHLPQTHAVIQLMRVMLDRVAPDVMLITETNVPHADNISYFGDGANEAQLVYNFALPPLVLHALHTGDASALTRWAATLALPSRHVTYFNFLASHDGIGLNPARGILTPAEIDNLVERTLAHGGLVSYKHNPDGSQSPYELNINYFDALSDPLSSEPLTVQLDRFLCAQAIMLAMLGVPGIYFHSLFGSRGDRAAAAASGINRRINRQKSLRPDLESELADPGSLRARVFARYAQLLRVRRGQPAFDPYGLQQVLPSDERIFAFWRIATSGERLLCLHNVSAQPVSFILPAQPQQTEWHDLLSAEKIEAADIEPAAEMQPYQVIWAVAKATT
jgi:sucrose phosphorylase